MKTLFLSVAVATASLVGFMPEKPEAIKNLNAEYREFEWVNPETNETIVADAWEFSPSQTDEIMHIILANDTAWFFEQDSNLFIVYWNPDVTVQSAYNKKGLVNHWVYESESFE